MDKIYDGTILIVEDENVFRMIYRGVLENAGFEVIEAENGRKGWEAIRTRKPDLVLLDLILPEMSGYEVLEKIRQDPETKEIPVIVFSVMGADENIQKALQLGANFFKIKGASSPSEILEQIDKILSRNQ
ncbi:MAG TPA: response regulator [bacterium]|nr:response regulator [bacterium]